MPVNTENAVLAFGRSLNGQRTPSLHDRSASRWIGWKQSGNFST